MPDPNRTSIAAALDQEDWLRQARERFGDNPRGWRFCCVSCGNVASVGDFEALGAVGQRTPFECIGRVHKEKWPDRNIDGNTKPCNWAANGLIRLSGLVEVAYTGQPGKSTFVFPFAEDGDR